MSTFRWEQGGEARLEHLQGDLGVFISTTASPPGRPLVATTGAGQRYQVKVRGCRRVQQSPERYRIEGRFFNLKRDDRLALAQLASEAERAGD